MENRILVLADDFFGENGEAASHFSELLLCLAPDLSVQFVLLDPVLIPLETLLQRAPSDIIGKQAGRIVLGLGLRELRLHQKASLIFKTYKALLDELLSKTKAHLNLVTLPEEAFKEEILQVTEWNQLLKTISHPRITVLDFADRAAQFKETQLQKGKFARRLYSEDSRATSLCHMLLGLFLQERILKEIKEMS